MMNHYDVISIDGICLLESLEQLDLGENEIDSLPSNFGALSRLRELWLDTNEIKELPLSMGGLGQLSIADFANNKIEEIPDTIQGQSSNFSTKFKFPAQI